MNIKQAIYIVAAVGITSLLATAGGSIYTYERHKSQCETWAETLAIAQACSNDVPKCFLTTKDVREAVDAYQGLQSCGAPPKAAHKAPASGTESL